MSGFSDEEREQIRTELIEAGREQLLTVGPDRTRVIDVTEPVGIAKPTFYRFFDSKEELYLEIYRQEIESFTDRLRADLAERDDPREQLEQFFHSHVEFYEENPYMQQAFSQNHPRDAIRGVSPEKLEETRQDLFDGGLPLIEAVQERSNGPISDLDPTTVYRLLKPIILLISDHQASSRDYYEDVRDVSISMLVRGLVLEE
ncbi:TetR/AcrR family transcriptional regulator [Salinilacihabitans rarus]|uniref:TetR/AcrR family transcriptional regulator n=1 Tax=Salinilacihabitans rarus TaxID=2961596 RepID=UPI0020C8C0E3|nr:TetR/AcrR family transcriptional regulator [Salinilacihabitans rarus]